MLSWLFIAALWSPAGNRLTSWLLLVMFIVILLLSRLVSWVMCGVLIVSFPDLCHLSYFHFIICSPVHVCVLLSCLGSDTYAHTL